MVSEHVKSALDHLDQAAHHLQKAAEALAEAPKDQAGPVIEALMGAVMSRWAQVTGKKEANEEADR
jgi:hypothetical protein